VPHAQALDNLRIKPGEGITGWVAEHKSVVALASNAQSDARFKRFQAWWKTPTKPSFRFRWYPAAK